MFSELKEEDMQSIEHVQETTLSDSGLYEVIEREPAEVSEDEVVRLKDALATERDRRLRLLAEFDNYRRRTNEERAFAEEAGQRKVLLALLDVMDDFDRALLHVGTAPDAVADGLKLIRQQLSDVLHSNGVTSFDCEGQQFDPTIHEAMTVIDSDGGEAGTVYAEARRGYFMNGRLLRPALVAVLK